MAGATEQERALPTRLIAGGAALVGLAVLGDSAIEHYRGAFHNPAMAAPLASSSLSILLDGLRMASTSSAPGLLHIAVQGAAVATGAAGLGFHTYDLSRRAGSAGFGTFFYGAPIGGPAALILAGALGAAADAMAREDARIGPVNLGDGRTVAAVAALGMAGSAAEATFLHFRGAFQNPFMWAPVVVPPLAAASLARDALNGEASRATFALLGATALLGLIGAGFHAYGVSRHMGGWRNWQQNLLDGPPIPAPPAFTGLAVAAVGALLLMRRGNG